MHFAQLILSLLFEENAAKIFFITNEGANRGSKAARQSRSFIEIVCHVLEQIYVLRVCMSIYVDRISMIHCAIATGCKIDNRLKVLLSKRSLEAFENTIERS